MKKSIDNPRSSKSQENEERLNRMHQNGKKKREYSPIEENFECPNHRKMKGTNAGEKMNE